MEDIAPPGCDTTFTATSTLKLSSPFYIMSKYTRLTVLGRMPARSVHRRLIGANVARSVVCESVCLCVCVSVQKVYCGKTVERIQMPFGGRFGAMC